MSAQVDANALIPDGDLRPKDDYMFEYTVSKVEERKIMNHHRFEETAAKYW